MAGPILPVLTSPELLKQHMNADLVTGGHGWSPKYDTFYGVRIDVGHRYDHEYWASNQWLAKMYDDMLPEGFHTHLQWCDKPECWPYHHAAHTDNKDAFVKNPGVLE